MKQGELRAADYLGHMLQAIGRISTYTHGMKMDAFLLDGRTQDAVIRNVEIIGEAANNLMRVAPDFVSRHPDIPWQEMYAMRNRVSHGYFSVDLEIVWEAILRDLPDLGRRIEPIFLVERASLSNSTTES